MKKNEKINCTLALAFLLLGVSLWFVPGVKFSAYLCAGITGLCVLWLLLGHLAKKSSVGKWFKRIFLVGLSAGILVLGCFEAAIITQGEEDNFALPVDAIIVLGAGVNGETPSLTLRTRIKAAADYMEQHPDVPVVLSGGRGAGEDITEAECMRRELWTNSEEWNQRYLLENQSTSTAENFKFSKVLLEECGIDTDTAVIAVVTNDFHIFRAKLIAQREDLHTIGVPAELPWWWLTANYYVREAFALVKTLIFD